MYIDNYYQVIIIIFCSWRRSFTPDAIAKEEFSSNRVARSQQILRRIIVYIAKHFIFLKFILHTTNNK